MFTLKSISLKFLHSAKTHIFSAISIIALTICLIVTMAVYIYNAQDHLDKQITSLFGEMDLLVGYDYGLDKYISKEAYNEISSLPTIEEISPVALAMLQVEHLSNVYSLGVANDSLVKSRYHFNSDLTTTTVAISELLAKTLNVKLGSELTIDGNKFTITEIVPTPMGAEPYNMVFLHNSTLTDPETVGLFLLIKTPNEQEVIQSLKEIDTSFRIDVVDEYDYIKKNLQSLMIFLIVLSILILLISFMLLLSTMQLFFTKLNNQLSILRSLGATSTQIQKLVQIQMQTILIAGVLVGTLISILSVKYGLVTLIDKLNLPAATTDIPILLVLGVIFIIGALLHLYMKLQMKKTMTILPRQMVNEEDVKELKWTKFKSIVVGCISLIAFILLLNGQLSEDGKGAIQILIGSILFILSILYAIPYSFQWLLAHTLKPIRKLLGNEMYLAFQQLIPRIRLNMKIVLSLIGLVIIFVFGSSMLLTIKDNERNYIERRYETDIILTNHVYDMNLKYDSVEPLLQTTTIESISPRSVWTSFSLSIDGDYWDIRGTDFESFGIDSKDFSNKIVITENFASKEQLNIGDWVQPYLFDETIFKEVLQEPLEVIAIVPSEYEDVGAYLDWSNTFVQKQLPIYEIFIESNNKEETIKYLEDLLSYWPQFKLLNKQTAIEQAEELFYQRWALFIGVFIIILVATTIGIIQTLMQMVYSNRKQYTIQRLIGMSPNGLIKLMLGQVLTFVVYGLTVGSGIGIILFKLVNLIDKQGTNSIDFITIGLISISLIVTITLLFGIKAYTISRKKLVDELNNM